MRKTTGVPGTLFLHSTVGESFPSITYIHIHARIHSHALHRCKCMSVCVCGKYIEPFLKISYFFFLSGFLGVKMRLVLPADFFHLASERGPEGVSCWVSNSTSYRISPTGHHKLTRNKNTKKELLPVPRKQDYPD